MMDGVSDMTTGDEVLVRVRLLSGRYEGLLTAPESIGIEAVHQGKVIAMARVTPEDGRSDAYRVALDLPAEVISDSVQVISLKSVRSGATLDQVTLMGGDALDQDIRAEMALLREELEMLKRAFRRHCADTATR